MGELETQEQEHGGAMEVAANQRGEEWLPAVFCPSRHLACRTHWRSETGSERSKSLALPACWSGPGPIDNAASWRIEVEQGLTVAGISYMETSLALSVTHGWRNALAPFSCEKRNSAVAPGREVGDSSKKLLSNKSQILKIEGPFRGVYWGWGEGPCLIKAIAGWVHLQCPIFTEVIANREGLGVIETG